MLLKVFFNANENRIRSAWRIIMYAAILIFSSAILGLVSGLFVLLLRGIFPGIITGSTLNQVTSTLLVALALVVGTFVTARWVDRRGRKSLGFRFDHHWWQDFSFGVLLGMVLMALIFFTELIFGMVKVEGFFSAQPDFPIFWLSMLAYAIHFIGVGIYEEIVFRGYLMINLAEGFAFLKKRRIALIASYLLISCVFGIMHAFNDNASAASILNIMVAGLMLGLGMLLTGRIGLSIGLHITWNFFQGNVFGFPVSGSRTGISFIGISQSGNELLTGGSFGPEGGLIGFVAIMIGIICILAWVKWRYGEIQLRLLDNLIYVEDEPKNIPDDDGSLIFPNLPNR
jgi:uncharacterized protein